LAEINRTSIAIKLFLATLLIIDFLEFFLKKAFQEYLRYWDFLQFKNSDAVK
jgi:hypothetical protein